MIQHIDHGGLDYAPAAYGTGRSLFRGPEREITPNSVVALGGTQTFGKFIAEPWPERLERSLGKPVINLGSVNAGADLPLNAPGLLDRINAAQVLVMELCGAAHLSNRFYSVHPLRNDRVLEVSPDLRRLYPEVDFNEFAFIRHMHGALRACDAARFAQVVEAMQQTWIARMGQLLAAVDRPVVGFWLSDAPPAQRNDALGPDPLFVTRGMVDRIARRLAALVEVTPGAEARALNVPGRIYGPFDRCAAETVFPAAIHQQVAYALAPAVRACLPDRARRPA